MQNVTQKSRFSKILVLGALALAATSFAFAQSFPVGSTMEKIQKKGELKVATFMNTKSFSILNPISGKPEGFEVDFGRYLAEKLTGSPDKMTIVRISGETRLPYVQTGQVDMAIATTTINDQRKQIVGFAGPYYITGQDAMLAKNDQSIKEIVDLNGKKVCVVNGTTSEANLLKVAPKVIITSLADAKGCIEGVVDGRYTAHVDDANSISAFASLQADKLKVLGKPFTKEPFGIVVQKDDVVFREWINQQIETMIKDGTWQKMYDKHLRSALGAPQIPVVERY